MDGQDFYEAGRCTKWWFESCARDDASGLGIALFMLFGAYMLIRWISGGRRNQ